MCYDLRCAHAVLNPICHTRECFMFGQWLLREEALARTCPWQADTGILPQIDSSPLNQPCAITCTWQYARRNLVIAQRGLPTLVRSSIKSIY